jgi:hypothetical protein
MMGAAFFSYVYTTVCLLRITESEKQQAKFGNKERPVLRQPKNACKAKKKQPYQKNDISVDGKSKELRNSRKREQGRRGNKGVTRSIFSHYKRSK